MRQVLLTSSVLSQATIVLMAFAQFFIAPKASMAQEYFSCGLSCTCAPGQTSPTCPGVPVGCTNICECRAGLCLEK